MTKAEKALIHNAETEYHQEPVLVVDPNASRATPFIKSTNGWHNTIKINIASLVEKAKEQYPEIDSAEVVNGIRGVQYYTVEKGEKNGSVIPACTTSLYNNDDLHDIRDSIYQLLDVAIVNNKQNDALKKLVQGAFDQIEARTYHFLHDSL